MGFGTHCEVCEYLLLVKHPDGLKKNEFVPELLRRGWSNRYDKDIPIGSKEYLDELKEIYEFAWKNVKEEKDGKFRGDMSWVASNVSGFCHLQESDTKQLLKARETRDAKALMYWEGNMARIFFDLDGDKKFKFYLGHAGTPSAWTHHIDLLYVAAELSDDEVWAASRDPEIGARIDVSLGIARWFSQKFGRDFYDICMEVYRDQRNCGLNVEPPNPVLKNLGKLDDIPSF
jgi:frataxin-like iron-binding protein CyaY